MQKAFAEILFDNVRAGLLDMWCSESRVALVAWDRRQPSGDRLCWQNKRSDTGIVINAARVGRMYLSAIEELPAYSDIQGFSFQKNDPGLAELREQIARFRPTIQGGQ